MGIGRSRCIYHYGFTCIEVRIIDFFCKICILILYFSISTFFSAFRNTPKTEEDWINLLQQQESLHNVEMRKWQRVLHTAAQLLRQVSLRQD